MEPGTLGRVYKDGEILVREGEKGDCMFVVLDGRLEVLVTKDGKETVLHTIGEGELIGEIAVFEHGVRSATVRAVGGARILTVDKKNFLRRVSEDPTIAFRLVKTMCRRVRELSDEVVRLRTELEAARGKGP